MAHRRPSLRHEEPPTPASHLGAPTPSTLASTPAGALTGALAFDDGWQEKDGGYHVKVRAEVRLAKQAAGEGMTRSASLPNVREPAEGQPPGSGELRGRGSRAYRECLVEAANTGGASIFWNSQNVPSMDHGVSQVRKRRQKLTDDLLREVAVGQGDPLLAVAWWFKVFEFYGDRPEDTALPDVPEGRFAEQEADPLEAIEKTQPRRPSSACAGSPTRRRSMASEAPRPASVPTCGFYGLSDAEEAPRQRQRPTLRQRPLIPVAPEALVDEERWQRRRRELRQSVADFTGKDSVLDPKRLCESDRLERQNVEDFIQRYDAHLEKLRRAELGIPDSPQATKVIDEEGCKTQAKLTLMFEKLIGAEAEPASPPVEKENRSASASDDDGSSATASATGDRNEESEKPAAEEVLLRGASLALLNCRLLRAARKSGKQQRKQSRAEVQQIRTRILRKVAPVEMSPKNLARALSCFGVSRRKVVDRIFAHLLRSVPQSTKQATTGGLPFEVFFRLMRALHSGAGPARKMVGGRVVPAPSLSASSPRSDAMAKWKDSELLHRLIFTLLTAREGPAASEGASLRREMDSAADPFPLAGVADAFRLILCAPVLLEAKERSTFGGGVPEFRGASAGLRGAEPGFISDLQAFSMLLHAELVEAEAEGSLTDGLDLSATVRTNPASQAPELLSFSGFQRFVHKKPEVFRCLVLLAMPLAVLGENLVASEIDSAARKIAHRAGELRAKVDSQTQLLQRRHWERLGRSLQVGAAPPARVRPFAALGA